MTQPSAAVTYKALAPIDIAIIGVYFLVVFAIAYQQFENYVVQPRIQSKAVSIDPFIVVIAALVGGTLLGVVGALLAIQLGVVGLVCLGIGGAAGDLEAPHGWTVWSALIVTSLIASALGFFVQTFAQQHAPPARTALILAAEPAFAGLFGWLLNDERLSATGWLGAALIMTAIVAVEIIPRFRPPRPLPEG